MSRRADWQARFWETLEAERSQPFIWGERDCVMFSARMADSIVSAPRYVAAAKATFHWTNERDALTLLRSKSLRSMVEEVLGPGKSWKTLAMGDIVLCAADHPVFDSFLAVHDGVNPIGKDDQRLITLRWSQAVCGWSI